MLKNCQQLSKSLNTVVLLAKINLPLMVSKCCLVFLEKVNSIICFWSYMYIFIKVQYQKLVLLSPMKMHHTQWFSTAVQEKNANLLLDYWTSSTRILNWTCIYIVLYLCHAHCYMEGLYEICALIAWFLFLLTTSYKTLCYSVKHRSCLKVKLKKQVRSQFFSAFVNLCLCGHLINLFWNFT